MSLPRNWTTYTAVALALLLGAYVALFEMEGDSGLLSAQPEAVQTLTVAGSDAGPIRLVRDESRWRMQSPVEWPADRLTVEELLRRLAEARPKRELGRLKGDKAGRYGLDEPYRQFTLATAEEEWTLRLGAETPLGGARYAAVGEQVLTLARPVVSTLEQDLTDLRDKQILSFATDDVRTIHIAGSDHSAVRLERDQHGDWRLTAPFRDDASDAAARRLLTDLSGLRARGFHDGVAPDSADLGLDRPLWRLRLKRQDAEPLRIRLARRQGSTDDPRAAETYVAGTPSHPQTAFDVRFSALTPRQSAVLQMLERQLTEVRAPEMGRITVERTHAPDLELVRTDAAEGKTEPSWRIQGTEESVDLEAVRRLAKALRDLRAEDVTAGGAVSSPALTLTVQRIGREQPLQLRLGAAPGGQPVAAAVAHRDHRYTLPAEQVAGLRKALAALREPD